MGGVRRPDRPAPPVAPPLSRGAARGVGRSVTSASSRPPCPSATSAAYDAAAVAMAAFFHDAVYDATRDDNEERSAVLAEHQLGSLGWDDARIRVVAALVRETATHASDGASTQPTHRRPVTPNATSCSTPTWPSSGASRRPTPRMRLACASSTATCPTRSGESGAVTSSGDCSSARRSTAVRRRREWWGARARANLTAELASLADRPPAADQRTLRRRAPRLTRTGIGAGAGRAATTAAAAAITATRAVTTAASTSASVSHGRRYGSAHSLPVGGRRPAPTTWLTGAVPELVTAPVETRPIAGRRRPRPRSRRAPTS